MTQPKILIVDNEIEICHLFKDFFDYIGYESVFETDGRKVLDNIGDYEYDLLFVDLKLETVSGVDIIRESKLVHPLSEVIVVTGFGSEDTVLTTRRFGASSYIQKPISFSDIRIQTEQALAKSRFNRRTQQLRSRLAQTPDSKHFETILHLERLWSFLNLTLDIDLLGDAILNGLAELIPAEYLTFFFNDDINREIIIYSEQPLTSDVIDDLEAAVRREYSSFANKALEMPVNVRISHSSVLDEESGAKVRDNAPSIFVPILIDNGVKGLLAATGFDGTSAETYRDLMHIVSGQVALVVSNATIHRDTKMLALTDGLTGLLNHRTFHTRLRQEFERFRRYGTSMSLIVADFDDLKTVNDNFGHPVGDQALRMIGEILKDATRETDILARYGGDEFVILLPQTSSQNAQNLAERIRVRIQNTPFEIQDSSFSCSISIGISTVPRKGVDSPQDFLESADNAMYKAKRSGKNRIEMAVPIP